MDAYVHSSLSSVFPQYSLLSSSDLTLTQLHSGTNTVFRVDAAGQDSVIFRKFGTCPIINRTVEHETFLKIAKAGLGPACLAVGSGFRVEELLSGRPISRTELPDLLELVACKVSSLHQLSHGSGSSFITTGIVEWGQMFESSAIAYVGRLNEARKELCEELLQAYREEKEMALALVPATDSLVFSHNDVSYTNILRYSHGIHLVDYEYASLCVPASDLATIANEVTYDYMAPAPHYFRYCSEDELSKERVNALVETYCREAGVDEGTVWRDFYKCRAAIHFVGFLWAACMYQPGGDGGFDLMKYSQSRLEAYRRMLDKIP